MRITIQSKNIDITSDIRDYIEKRVTNLEKLIASLEKENGEAEVNFEISKSNHHKSGIVFHVDCNINVHGRQFYYSCDAATIHEAIDEVKERLYEEIRRNKDRKQTLMKRGAASVKKMLKGLSKRNPFTSKYD